MIKNGAGILVVLGLLLLTFSARAQEAPVKATVDKQKILIGEPLLLKLEVKADKGNTASFRLDTIPHFEFLKKDSVANEESGGVQVIAHYYRLTSFDSGRWVIPPIAITPDAKTEAIYVEVVFTSPFDPGQPYHDIQDIRTVPFQLSKGFEKWWYLIALLLMMLTVAIYWMTEDQKPRKEVQLARGAYARAKQELKALQTAGVTTNRYYAKLVEIFRTYLSERAKVNSLQQTSGSLAGKVKPFFNDGVLYTKVAGVLSLCDLVKFAQYEPATPETKGAHEVIDQAVDHIEAAVKQLAQKTHPTSVLKENAPGAVKQ
ncbi:MAG: hypothetical protein J7539_13635 [Niabella sp.]|nr:hypothetical protein [Niabella sp.]